MTGLVPGLLVAYVVYFGLLLFLVAGLVKVYGWYRRS